MPNLYNLLGINTKKTIEVNIMPSIGLLTNNDDDTKTNAQIDTIPNFNIN